MKWVFLVLSACAFAQTPAEQRGKKLIDQAIQALGGDNFLKRRTASKAGAPIRFIATTLRAVDIARIYTRYITVPTGKSGEKYWASASEKPSGSRRRALCCSPKMARGRSTGADRKNCPRIATTGIGTRLSATFSTFCACAFTSLEWCSNPAARM